MSLFILDTDTFSFAQHGQTSVLTAIVLARSLNHTVAITTITVEEQFKGWQAAFQKARTDAERAKASLRLSNAIPLWAAYSPRPQTEASLTRFEALVSMKLNVGKMDLRIASIAVGLSATVVTHNTRDFGRVPNLRHTDWTLPETLTDTPLSPHPEIPQK